jgi:hypothetical protein
VMLTILVRAPRLSPVLSRETGLPFRHSEFPKPYIGVRQLGSVPTSDQTHLAYGRRASTALSILHSVFGTLRDVS